MLFQQTMTRDKTTKNTVVYKAPAGSHIPLLYIQQDAFPGKQFPDTITIRVEVK